MTEEEFFELVKLPESDVLDYKREGYDFSSSAKKNDFIKDVLAMANTPRSCKGRIVLGVSWTPEWGSELVGLEKQLDDTEFQNAVGIGWTQPKPRFVYKPISAGGKFFGIIEIELSNAGPFSTARDGEGLQAGAIYWRRGTQNDRAIGTDLMEIFNWFRDGESPDYLAEVEQVWPIVFNRLHCFDGKTSYILISDRISPSSVGVVTSLANVSWKAVFDLDPMSEQGGLLSMILSAIQHRQLVHRMVHGDSMPSGKESGVAWYFARGLEGRRETLSDGDYKVWIKQYKRELARHIQELATKMLPDPVVVVVLLSDIGLKKHIRAIVEELVANFGESVEVVGIVPTMELARALADGDDDESLIKVHKLDLRSFCNGIAVHFADQKESELERCVMPSLSGASVEIPREISLWLQEHLELVDRNAGQRGEDDSLLYRRGADITWRNLNLRHDCQRDIQARLHRDVDDELRRRHAVKIDLYHMAGAGGTTVSLRVAWDLHATYPVVRLKVCSPKDTADRIGKLAALTGSCVLVLIDGGNPERDIDALFEYLRASHIPAVLFRVTRRFTKPKIAKRQYWLEAELSDYEAERFKVSFHKDAPLKKVEISTLASSKNSSQRSAFFFGLTAFEKEFLGLTPHVYSRLSSLSEVQLKVICFIALTHYYGQEALPPNSFASLLGIPRTKYVDITNVFTGDGRKALELLILNENSEWRTTHQMVALEIIRQVLAGQSENLLDIDAWRQRLSVWAKDLANLCRGDEPVASDRMLSIVRRIFIYRENLDFLGSEIAANPDFSKIIEEIPSKHGRLELLNHLISCYPEEAHLYAHLGRFQGLNGAYDDGLFNIEKAISLQKDDHVLHHMRGMLLRQKMRAIRDEGASVDDMVNLAIIASESFQASRNLNPEKEHGYIGEIQMLIQLIDWSAQLVQVDVWKMFSLPKTHIFLRNSLERAESLLDAVQNLYADEKPSHFVVDCRAKLQRIYGDYSSALQSWDSLLSRVGTNLASIRRQIVWTILRKNKGSFHSMSDKERDRIITLLKENLDEDVNDDTSLRLWLRAIRQNISPPSLDSLLEKVAYWKSNTNSLDSAYYLYVLHTLNAMSGSRLSLVDAQQALDDCRSLARYRRDRTKSFEWIGVGKGIAALVHQSRLGEWEGDFWQETAPLRLLTGRIVSIDGPQKGEIELNGDLRAFFLPAKSDIHRDRDENANVSCFVGFSYDGLRAWNVKKAV